MIPIFLGLSAANLLFMLGVFAVGLGAFDPSGQPTSLYPPHLLMGMGAGLLCTLAHLSVFTYFMATSKWLAAATEKAGFAPARFQLPARYNKTRALLTALAAILCTALAMFAGAAADPTIRPWWPGEVHLVMAALALGVNLLCTLIEHRLIRRQQQLMDNALILVNLRPDSNVQPDGT